jgi:ABC-2 type transport system permease protein
MMATLRAVPTLLRVGFAEAIAYRAETIVWILTNTMPLVNLALWSAVARGGVVGGFAQADLVAYFLVALGVRQLTGSWVLWEMSRDIRLGTLSMRLLRPIHPLVAYAAENLAGIPLRAGLAIPLTLVALFVAARTRISHDPIVWLIVPATFLGAWLITFSSMVLMGAIGFFTEQAVSVFDVWLALFFTMSGYMFPLDFIRARVPGVVQFAKALPFYSMNGFPVELLLGMHDRGEALKGLAVQWTWVAVLATSALWIWQTGMKRYNAYGA